MVSPAAENLKTIKKVLLAPAKFLLNDNENKACFSYNYKQYGAFETWELAWDKLSELPHQEMFFTNLSSHNVK